MVSNNYVGSTPTFGTKKIKSQTSMNYLTKTLLAERRFVKKNFDFENYFISSKYLKRRSIFRRISVSYPIRSIYSSVTISLVTIKKFYNELSDQKCNS